MMSDHASGDVAAAYDRWAATYDADCNLTRDLDADVVRRAGPRIAGRDVLEIGCGTGKNTTWFAKHARSVVALDFSSLMIERARERITSAHVMFIEHDVTTPWPIPSATIDVVVANLVLEHVPNLRPIFDQAARVLRRGGHMFVCELHPERQRAGGQAEFTDRSTGALVKIRAHQHTVADFVNDGQAAGLTVRNLGEYIEDSAAHDAVPRLLSVLFEK